MDQNDPWEQSRRQDEYDRQRQDEENRRRQDEENRQKQEEEIRRRRDDDWLEQLRKQQELASQQQQELASQQQIRKQNSQQTNTGCISGCLSFIGNCIGASILLLLVFLYYSDSTNREALHSFLNQLKSNNEGRVSIDQPSTPVVSQIPSLSTDLPSSIPSPTPPRLATLPEVSPPSSSSKDGNLSLELTNQDLLRLSIAASELEKIDKSTDQRFHVRHPEFRNKSIAKGDDKSAREWFEIRRCNVLVDYLFYRENPQMRDKQISNEQPELKKEWNRIQQQVGKCSN
jgi:hypothetical protein